MTFEVASVDDLFTVPVMRELCKLDSIIDSTEGSEERATQLK